MNRKYGRPSAWIVQQGVWDLPKESMPLAAGYLKATALEDETIRREMDIRIFNFRGGDTVMTIAEGLFAEGAPDVLGLSVFGWNYQAFSAIAETFKQIRPAGWVVFGGTHVANQGERVLRQHPAVDVVVNTEGEFVFRELLQAYLAGRRSQELHGIPGISFRQGDGTVRTMESEARIQDLDRIPSPFLTGAIPLVDDRGEFRYDVALMETNRGCPYRCAFCYWGGAIGQKIRTFSRDRLRAELEVFGQHRVDTIVLCDSNFGMLPKDLEVIEDAIHTREKCGYPRSVETSWAKNKSKHFYEIVRRMKAHSMQSSFTLALQTLDQSALDQMQRRNMRLNDWEELVHWLRREGLDCYAELIWGAPGETVDSFLEGYDRLARYVTRIAVYPLLLLPNTEYSEGRKRFGFKTVRGERDDFEYVLAHNTMTMAENLEMKRFLLWARSLAEHLVFRHIWAPLRELGGMTQSAVIRSLMTWFDGSDHPAAVRLSDIAGRLMRQPSTVPTFLPELYGEQALDELFEAWWRESVLPGVPSSHGELLAEVLKYDCLTRPVYDPAETASFEILEIDGHRYYRRPAVWFAYDVPAILAAFERDEEPRIERRPTEVTVYSRVGFYQYYANHETGVYFVGKTAPELGQIGPGSETLEEVRS